MTSDTNALINDWATLEPLSPDVDVPFEKLTVKWDDRDGVFAQVVKARGFPRSIVEIAPDVYQYSWTGLHITKSPTCPETGRSHIIVAWSADEVWQSVLRALSRMAQLARLHRLAGRARCPICNRIYWHKRGAKLGLCKQCSRPLTNSPVWVGKTPEVAA